MSVGREKERVGKHARVKAKLATIMRKFSGPNKSWESVLWKHKHTKWPEAETVLYIGKFDM